MSGQGPRAPPDADSGASDPDRAPVLSRIVIIPNKRGLHARAAARFVTLAERFGAGRGRGCATAKARSARSIMGLMMLGAGQGAEIELRAEGWDARARHWMRWSPLSSPASMSRTEPAAAAAQEIVGACVAR